MFRNPDVEHAIAAAHTAGIGHLRHSSRRSIGRAPGVGSSPPAAREAGVGAKTAADSGVGTSREIFYAADAVGRVQR